MSSLFLVENKKGVLGKMPPRKITPTPTPPTPPHPFPVLKKYSMKLPRVKEYLNGKNFVNFNFRQF